MDCKLGCRFTARAERDLDSILEYISEELCSPNAAAALGRKVFDCLDRLRMFPNSGKKVDNPYINDESLRKVFIDEYVLYYKVSETDMTLYVVAMIYGRRDLVHALRDLDRGD